MLPGDAAVLMQARQCYLVGSQCHMAEKTRLIYGNNALFPCQWKGRMAAGLTLLVIETVKSTSLLLEGGKKPAGAPARQSGRQHLHSAYCSIKTVLLIGCIIQLFSGKVCAGT